MQTIERIEAVTPYGKKSCVVAYSLGNFVSSMSATRNKDGMMLRLLLEKDLDGKVSVAGVEYITTRTSSYQGNHYTVLPNLQMYQQTGSSAYLASNDRVKKVMGDTVARPVAQ